MDAITATEPNGSPQHAAGGETARNVGRIEEIQGVVIEAVFPDRLPEINHAITVARPAAAADEEAPGISTVAGEGILVCEVQQHLGDDRVRAVAMDSTDGIARGLDVTDTGGPISVPVGDLTLGRLWNVLGEPVDKKPAPPAGDFGDGPRKSIM
jgi:F-type H+-transporting ATPase subunit beta